MSVFALAGFEHDEGGGERAAALLASLSGRAHLLVRAQVKKRRVLADISINDDARRPIESKFRQGGWAGGWVPES